MTGDRLTLRHIRFYDKHHRPEKFGRLVRFLNWIRWGIELMVQRLLLWELYKASREELPYILFRIQFETDVRMENQAYKTGTLPKYRRTVFPELLGTGDPTAASVVVQKRGGRSPDASEESVLSEPPKPLDTLIARYGHPGGGRSAKRGSQVVVEEFEELGLSAVPVTTKKFGTLDVPKESIVGSFKVSSGKKEN